MFKTSLRYFIRAIILGPISLGIALICGMITYLMINLSMSLAGLVLKIFGGHVSIESLTWYLKYHSHAIIEPNPLSAVGLVFTILFATVQIYFSSIANHATLTLKVFECE